MTLAVSREGEQGRLFFTRPVFGNTGVIGEEQAQTAPVWPGQG